MKRLAHVFGLDGDFLRLLGEHVLAGDNHVALAPVLEGQDGADLNLDDLCRALADLDAEQIAQVHGDGFVHAVARKAKARGRHDAAQGDDGHLGGAAADVDDHRACRFGDGQIGAHRRSHRLFDKVRLAGTRLDGGLEDGALLDGRGAAGNADDNARLGLPRVLADRRLVDERREHGLRHVVVGDDAVFERMLGGERLGRVVDHVLRLVADGENAMGALLDGDDRGLVDDDALARHRDERVRGSKVDGHIGAHLARKVREPIHKRHKSKTP